MIVIVMGLLVMQQEILVKNAIYSAMKDIEWFSTYAFPNISDTLGEVKMTVTQIESGQQHNVIPDICSFVVDIRITDCYTHQDILSIIQQNVSCEIKPRSLRLGPSTLPHNHPFIILLLLWA